MEKYGFVYIWRDKKHGRYYIGSHWGTEDDGYICSSSWMKQAYKLRPHDFRRKILSRTNDRTLLFKEEFKWLSFIKEHEIKSRYYNLNIKATGHWTVYPDKVKTISEKISHRTKEAMQRPDVREKYLKSIEGMDRTQSEETRQKRSESMKKTMAVKYPEDSKKKRMEFDSPEYKEFMVQHAKNMHANRSENQKKDIGLKISEALKGKTRPYFKDYKWWTNGIMNKRMKDCPGDGWVLGKTMKEKT